MRTSSSVTAPLPGSSASSSHCSGHRGSTVIAAPRTASAFGAASSHAPSPRLQVSLAATRALADPPASCARQVRQNRGDDQRLAAADRLRLEPQVESALAGKLPGERRGIVQPCRIEAAICQQCVVRAAAAAPQPPRLDRAILRIKRPGEWADLVATYPGPRKYRLFKHQRTVGQLVRAHPLERAEVDVPPGRWLRQPPGQRGPPAGRRAELAKQDRALRIVRRLAQQRVEPFGRDRVVPSLQGRDKPVELGRLVAPAEVSGDAKGGGGTRAVTTGESRGAEQRSRCGIDRIGRHRALRQGGRGRRAAL